MLALITFASVLALAARCVFLERKAARMDSELSAVLRFNQGLLYGLSLSANLLERLSREKNGTEPPKDIQGEPLAFGQKVRFAVNGSSLEGIVSLNIRNGDVDFSCPFCILAQDNRLFELREVYGLTIIESIQFPASVRGRD